ncbi:YqcC family protein [Catenovulum agarivorans]|uniref:YqcC family protein n=1 Tax=Catenovulum agarivorans TaxID=1172192 RepID=UPI0004B54933|nr:YqcC family protein [Catenovulum agarivorans]
MSKHQQIASLLTELAAALQAANLWQQHRPSAQALNSSQPFCIDTLDFHQWLQFIFIEKMQIIAEQQLTLPSQLCISPIAEDAFNEQTAPEGKILAVIKQIDALFA